MISQTDPAATCPGSARCRPRSGTRSVRTRSVRLLVAPTLVWLMGSLLIATGVRLGVWPAGAASDALWVGAICFAASVASLLPVGLLAARPTAQLPFGLLATVGIRGGMTVSALIGSIAAGWIDGGAVAVPVSVSLWYAALLVADLVVVTRFFSSALAVSVDSDPERATC